LQTTHPCSTFYEHRESGTVCCPSSLPLTMYKNGGVRSSGQTNNLLAELQTTHPRSTFCEHRKSGRAGLRNRRSQRYTCTGVRAIKFLGERTRDCSLHPLDQCRFVYIRFFVVGTVRETTLQSTFCFPSLCMFHFCLVLIRIVVHPCTYMS
jgi:hypothetical protein